MTQSARSLMTKGTPADLEGVDRFGERKCLQDQESPFVAELQDARHYPSINTGRGEDGEVEAG